MQLFLGTLRADHWRWSGLTIWKFKGHFGCCGYCVKSETKKSTFRMEQKASFHKKSCLQSTLNIRVGRFFKRVFFGNFFFFYITTRTMMIYIVLLKFPQQKFFYSHFVTLPPFWLLNNLKLQSDGLCLPFQRKNLVYRHATKTGYKLKRNINFLPERGFVSLGSFSYGRNHLLIKHSIKNKFTSSFRVPQVKLTVS